LARAHPAPRPPARNSMVLSAVAPKSLNRSAANSVNRSCAERFCARDNTEVSARRPASESLAYVCQSVFAKSIGYSRSYRAWYSRSRNHVAGRRAVPADDPEYGAVVGQRGIGGPRRGVLDRSSPLALLNVGTPFEPLGLR
jgi:hypothetical protein